MSIISPIIRSIIGSIIRPVVGGGGLSAIRTADTTRLTADTTLVTADRG